MVKRVGNLWGELVSMDNLRDAYCNSRRGKSSHTDVAKVDQNPMKYLEQLRLSLIRHEFKSAGYKIFEIQENGKTREVADVGYFPDRIVHWALMNVIKPKLMNKIIPQSYAAIEGRGAHMALTKMKEYLKDEKGTKYCFKMDVKKFFPSVDKDILMKKLRRCIKDTDVLWLCSEIIYGYPGTGLPIGNYTSQYFANFYLADIDRYFKEQFHAKYYLRYMDDIVIFGETKAWLRRVKKRMDRLLKEDGLTMKHNWQIFPVEARGVDFVGYVTFHEYCLLRKRTKNRMKRSMARLSAKLSGGNDLNASDLGCLWSYHGILKWCDSWRLAKKTVKPVIWKKELRKWTF